MNNEQSQTSNESVGEKKVPKGLRKFGDLIKKKKKLVAGVAILTIAFGGIWGISGQHLLYSPDPDQVGEGFSGKSVIQGQAANDCTQNNLAYNKNVIVHDGNVNYSTTNNTWPLMVDCNATTGWLVSTNPSTNAVVDLGSVVTISSITYNLSWDGRTQFGTQAGIELAVSNDNKTWTLVAGKLVTNRSQVAPINGINKQARYVRLRWLDAYGSVYNWNGWGNIFDLDVRGINGSNITPTAVITQSPVNRTPTAVTTQSPVNGTQTAVATLSPVNRTPTVVITQSPINGTQTAVAKQSPIIGSPTPVATEVIEFRTVNADANYNFSADLKRVFCICSPLNGKASLSALTTNNVKVVVIAPDGSSTYKDISKATPYNFTFTKVGDWTVLINSNGIWHEEKVAVEL
ncbi:MAG: discoidin domain-containing protein [bacterium]